MRPPTRRLSRASRLLSSRPAPPRRARSRRLHRRPQNCRPSPPTMGRRWPLRLGPSPRPLKRRKASATSISRRRRRRRRIGRIFRWPRPTCETRSPWLVDDRPRRARPRPRCRGMICAIRSLSRCSPRRPPRLPNPTYEIRSAATRTLRSARVPTPAAFRFSGRVAPDPAAYRRRGPPCSPSATEFARPARATNKTSPLVTGGSSSLGHAPKRRELSLRAPREPASAAQDGTTITGGGPTGFRRPEASCAACTAPAPCGHRVPRLRRRDPGLRAPPPGTRTRG